MFEMRPSPFLLQQDQNNEALGGWRGPLKTVDKYGKTLGETGIAIQIQNVRLDVNFQFEREDTVIGLDLVEKLLKLARMSRENLDKSIHKDLSGEINIILTESVVTFDPCSLLSCV